MTDIQQGALIELARRDFFDYCHLLAPDFYKPERAYLVELCHDLQHFMTEDNHDVLVINEPPRHGKSRTVGMFTQWLLGQNQQLKVMTGSYNETLSTTFSKSVRNAIQELKADKNKIVYHDIFPKTMIQLGDGAMNLWSLKGGHNNYLATSPTGTSTGFGADLIIIDDLIKLAEEANNAEVLRKHWEWFINTMLSRLESGGKIIVIMTRWHSLDLAGHVLQELPLVGYRVKHISMKAVQDDGKMLCEDILNFKEYQRKTKVMGADVASANYQQEPIDIKGRLYSQLQTYTNQATYLKIWNYTDTADKGADYLMSVVFGETVAHQAEVLDVLYTKEEMSVTEKAAANQMKRFNVNHARIEGNNGGVGYKRAVERICREELQHVGTIFEDFHQTANKQARIISNATWLEQNVYLPDDWRLRWPEFYEAMMSYQREGKNTHDDAPDGMTGIAEILQTPFNPLALAPRLPRLKGRRVK